MWMITDVGGGGGSRARTRRPKMQIIWASKAQNILRFEDTPHSPHPLTAGETQNISHFRRVHTIRFGPP